MLSHRKTLLRRTARLAACGALVVAGCDFLDPTNVTNPNTTSDDLAGSDQPTSALLPGLRAQMARMIGSLVTISDIASDNFEIAFTNITGELNDPHLIDPGGGTYNSTGGAGLYWNTQELRALADFVIDTIAPGDDNATARQLAEARYYRGMAYLIQGESFIGVPTGPDEEPTSSQGLLGLAEDDFLAALQSDPGSELQLKLQAALARAYRDMGDATAAEQYAELALAADPDLLVMQPYSAGEIENPVYGDERTREPLPRLDFLDPKYTTRDAGIPLGKAEEMHLILAEIEMARGNYAAAAALVGEAVRIAHARPTVQANDLDKRLNPDLTVRPRDAVFRVRADPESPYRDGLVLTRPGVVEVPSVSGSSLDADSVAALTNPEAVRHAFWLARQEILFLEGRRLHDLGVRMPISQREIDASAALSDDDPEATVQVPAYIPANTIDRFSPRSPYANPTQGGQPTTTLITIDVDMNRVLAQQKVSRFGPLP